MATSTSGMHSVTLQEVVRLLVVRRGGQLNLSQLVQKLLGVLQSGLILHLHGTGLSCTLHSHTHSLKLL